MRRAVIGSNPVRHGSVYCSRRCGGGCTYAAYLEAKRTAEQLAAQLGAGWTPRVWDNLGWHWSVYYGRDPHGISMSGGHTLTRRYYSLIVNGYAGGRSYSGRSPRNILRRARRDVIAFAARVMAAGAAFPPARGD